jgi:hypothetical protein
MIGYRVRLYRKSCVPVDALSGSGSRPLGNAGPPTAARAPLTMTILVVPWRRRVAEIIEGGGGSRTCRAHTTGE